MSQDIPDVAIEQQLDEQPPYARRQETDVLLLLIF